METIISNFHFWNNVPMKVEDFAIFSDRCTNKFTEIIYEIEIQTQIWNVNLHMGTVISNRRIWNVDSPKLRVLPFLSLLRD